MSTHDVDRLRAYYRALTDEALVRQHGFGPAGFASESVWRIVDDEFKARGLQTSDGGNISQYSDPKSISSAVPATAAPTHLESYRVAPLFAVSLVKLAVMSLCTLGLYELYWAYKHWDAERRRERENLSPFWRAFFAPLWGFSLFPRIQRLAATHGVPATWSGSGLGLSYFLLNLTWRLPGALWLVSLLKVVPLLFVQRSVNTLNAAVVPSAPRNEGFSGVNIAAILVGGLLLLFAIWGSLLPPT
jgi:hypothetical protein